MASSYEKLKDMVGKKKKKKKKDTYTKPSNEGRGVQLNQGR